MRPIRWALVPALAAALVFSGPRPAAAQEEKAKVTLFVKVPADATLEIDGTPTKLTGTLRIFESPELAVGKNYIYTFKATFTQDGKPVTVTKEVTVTPGRGVEVDLTKADAPKPEPKPEPKPAPRPEPKPEAKPEPKPAPKPAPKPPEPKPEPKPAPKPEPKPEAKPEPKPAPKVEKKPEAKPEPKPEPKVEKKELDVPYVPTPEPVVEAMLKLAGVKEGDTVYDLGCGDGRIVITAVKKFKAAKGVGIDLDPERIKDSLENAKKEKVEGKVEFKQGDVLAIKELDANVVTLYLLPEINLKLLPVLKKLKPGSRVVSHAFDMDKEWKPDETKTVTDADGVEHEIFLWTVK
jgi:uncharacterized protein (TIGR03000 family)